MQKIKKQLIYCVLALLLGAIIGALEAGFCWGLKYVGGLRESNIYLLVPFLAVGGLLIVYFFKNYGKDITAGIGMVFDAWHNDDAKIPLKSIPFMIGGTWLTHLLGGSSGREGVAVQIGASVAHTVGKKVPYDDAAKVLMIAGMAAGFAGVFRTPLTGIAFALEVLIVGELRYEGILPAVIAAFTADIIAGGLLLKREAFSLLLNVEVDVMLVGKIIVAGILFGFVGALFAHSLKKTHKVLESKIPNPYIRIAIFGVIISAIMILMNGRYSGSGYSLIEEAFTGGEIYWYDWLLKILLTVITLAAGFKGGEVMPLFSIGTTFGFIIGPLLGIPTMLSAALGYAAVFGSGTGTLIAPVLVGGEIFGWEYTPLFIAVCLTARIVNEGYTIYSGQKRSYIKDV